MRLSHVCWRLTAHTSRWADVQEELGQQVAARVRAAGGEALFVRCDVPADGEVDSAIDKVLEWRDRLDYAFNNAGVPPADAPTARYPEDDWDRIIAINLKGIWRCMVRELAEMSDRGGGAIVNMSSVAGVAGFPFTAPYTASKFAIRGITRVAALEYATQNVRINAVCPAYVDTPGLRDGARGCGCRCSRSLPTRASSCDWRPRPRSGVGTGSSCGISSAGVSRSGASPIRGSPWRRSQQSPNR